VRESLSYCSYSTSDFRRPFSAHYWGHSAEDSVTGNIERPTEQRQAKSSGPDIELIQVAIRATPREKVSYVRVLVPAHDQKRVMGGAPGYPRQKFRDYVFRN
jgi:hypothetical protein